ncbi:protein of unknown function [Methylococcus capsulatus]|uniref:Uncharacterized protein n=1 Tax=Methylococcus capsulatus TaxID=414 RepID=A0AA35XX96_METCP|nr:protein of unknown function [Methylococcus capsulatus]
MATAALYPGMSAKFAIWLCYSNTEFGNVTLSPQHQNPR